jgi:chromosome condensin MukBEF complex kleisin-like MukF subunit
MPDVAPVVTVLPTPAVSVTSINQLTYNQLQQSIGSYAYLLNSIYEYTEQTSQLLQPIGLRKYNVRGSKDTYNLQMAVDPYQFVASIHEDTIGLDYAFDGNNNFFFFIEPNTYAQLQFEVVEIAPIMLLNQRCLFEEIEFLEDYLITF